MPYYKVQEIGQNTYSLFEMVGVGSHLIVGSDSALLIDTGYGFGNLRKEVEKITRLPLIVVNSHVHADHSLGNSQFEEVYISAEDMPQLHGDYLQKQYGLLTGYGAKMYPALRLVLLYGKIKRKPVFDTAYRELADGAVFDLGGRTVRFMTVPGHTPGSVVALDEQSKTMFAGDAVNPGAFLFFDPQLKLRDYAGQMDKLAQLEGYDQLRISHKVEPLPFSFVAWYADFLRRADIEKSTATDFPNGDRAVYQYTEQDGPYGECSAFFAADNILR